MLCRSLKYLVCLAGLMIVGINAYPQENQIPVKNEQTGHTLTNITHYGDFGIGVGLDYGGAFGVQVGVAPVRHLTLFAAGGYYLYEFGWEVGAKFLFISKTSTHKVRPFLKAMYGVNSVISTDLEEYNKVYKGFTVGLGCEFRFGRQKKDGFDLDLNVPLRTPDFWEDYHRMENDPRLDVLQGPLPVAFSIGYHHEF